MLPRWAECWQSLPVCVDVEEPINVGGLACLPAQLRRQVVMLRGGDLMFISSSQHCISLCSLLHSMPLSTDVKRSTLHSCHMTAHAGLKQPASIAMPTASHQHLALPQPTSLAFSDVIHKCWIQTSQGHKAQSPAQSHDLKPVCTAPVSSAI